MADKRESSEINFPKVLFRHLDRIAMSNTTSEYQVRVSRLEDLLFPYFDDEYYDDMKKPVTEYDNAVAICTITHKNDMVEKKQAMMVKAMLRALMSLAKRKALLIEEQVYGEDEDDTDYEAGETRADA